MKLIITLDNEQTSQLESSNTSLLFAFQDKEGRDAICEEGLILRKDDKMKVTARTRSDTKMMPQVIRLIQLGYSTQSIERQTGVDAQKITAAREVLKDCAKDVRELRKARRKLPLKRPSKAVNFALGLAQGRKVGV